MTAGALGSRQQLLPTAALSGPRSWDSEEDEEEGFLIGRGKIENASVQLWIMRYLNGLAQLALSRPDLLQFIILKIRLPANFMSFSNVVPRILKLQNCEMVGRDALTFSLS